MSSTHTEEENAHGLELRGGRESIETSSNNDNTVNVIEASALNDSNVPDGGYGWVVVGCCAILTWWVVGTTYTWGIFQSALVEEHLAPTSTLSFVGSLTAACISVFAVLNARVIRALGARWTAMLGISLYGLGQMLSGFATHNIGGLFVTTGAIMGVGSSLCFMVASSVPAQYFSRKRGLANGIVFAGGGLGGAVDSFLVNALITRFGPPWTFRIMGFLILATGLPAAYLIKERAPSRTRSFIDVQLFRDFRFVVLFFAGALGTFPLFVPPFFLPMYCRSLGLSTTTGAALLSAFNFSSALGRIGFGFASDGLGPVHALFIALFLTALSMLVLWPVSSTLAPLILFVLINGAANGGFFATMPTVVGTVFGSARVSVALGMIITGWLGGYLLGAPIAGYLLAAYGGAKDQDLKPYHPAIFYAGSMALGAAILIAAIRLKTSTKVWKKV